MRRRRSKTTNITLRGVAQASGVSRASVSIVPNNAPLACPRFLGVPARFVLAALVFATSLSLASAQENGDERLFLRSGWTLQSSCSVSGTGEQISNPDFKTDGWHATTVPSTVVAALVADKTYPDPYYGDNLRSIPGTTYPMGKNFSVLPIPEDSPFRCSWWYRAEFRLPQSFSRRHAWLYFGGINNRANIWLNGHKIADAKDIAGAYRTYEFDVAPLLVAGEANVLAVETIAQTEKDLGINWVDWNPSPPDKDMGLWREVYLQSSGPVAIRHPQVITHFPGASLDEADLTVEAELRNATSEEVAGVLKGRIEDVEFSQTVAVKPKEVRMVRFTPDQFAQLRVKHLKLWWPRQMGEPHLHEVSLDFVVGGHPSDSQTARFGIREITSELDARGHLIFRVNGKRILIRGGGWAPDMLFRQSRRRLEDEFRYIRDLNLNTVRLEGKLETDDFYSLADEQGVLVMAGWCCCDLWEQWARWKPGDLEIATASLRSQILRMRSHPSMLVWLNGSDFAPPAKVERAYIEVLKELDWPNPYISSASQASTTVTGPSGVKMTGPYDYAPPDYWLTDTAKHGGAYGFNTETGPGPAVPPVSCLRKMLPPNHIRPDDPIWNYHAGSEGFRNLSHFDEAMKSIYGPASSIGDYELKAQAMAYDAERAMFEAYSQNKYVSTGVIQWMLNNAWPSLIWHLYDYFLQPAGGYFGAKKACEPLHAQYSYDDRSVVVVNSTYRDFSDLKLTAKLYDVSLQPRYSSETRTNAEADGVAKVLTLPEDAFNPRSLVYFLKLALEERDGTAVSSNFYWLSAKRNVYEWAKTDYRFTPVSSYEDLTALQTLPKDGSLEVSANVTEGDEGPLVHVRVANPGNALAFQIHLGIHPKSREMEILPVLWDDNYLELMPGESRDLTARFLSHDALENGAELTVTGWNVEATTVSLTPAKERHDATDGVH